MPLLCRTFLTLNKKSMWDIETSLHISYYESFSSYAYTIKLQIFYVGPKLTAVQIKCDILGVCMFVEQDTSICQYIR